MTARNTRTSAAVLAAAALLLAGCAGTAPSLREARSLGAASQSPGARSESLGVKVEGLRLSAAGYMLDLRYRVVDVDKAQALFERKARPMLVDSATGLQLGVPNTPKLGQLRTTGTRNVKANRTYSMLFANPARHIERGTRLALVIGDERVDGLTVE
jgi:hypothetical protein